MADAEARRRIAVLEEDALTQNRELCAVQLKLSRQIEVAGRLGRAEAEIARLPSL
jgi:hypothetical protein